jgi:D-alanyl-D-alanine carboxypeptidase
LITEKIAEVTSPPLHKMIRFALLYSDNVLSQRLAMVATGRSGYPLTKTGFNQMAKDKLNAIGIDTTGMKLVDGSGIGGENRIPLASAKTEQEIYNLNHHSNLQPMWWYENMIKGASLI